MTTSKLSAVCAVALLAAVVSPAAAMAQSPALPEALEAGPLEPLATDQDAYGTAAETLVPVDAYEFEGMDSSVTTGWVPIVNRRYRTGGTNTLLTAGLRVPSGALLTKVEITGCDTDAAGSMEGSIVECPLTGENCIVSATAISTTGQPGCATFTTTLPVPRTVDHSATSYSVIVHLPTVGPSLSFRRMAVYYKLQVSPAPSTARFTDVPVGHPLHRFVEALASAGITGGCGGDLYCPNATLTRGQMAAFLSVALGLHWPN